jgi:hypothetical protein
MSTARTSECSPHPMPAYRILVFDYGHINASHTVEVATDGDAIKAAQELRIASDIEVWERDRFIARLKPQQSD